MLIKDKKEIKINISDICNYLSGELGMFILPSEITHMRFENSDDPALIVEVLIREGKNE